MSETGEAMARSGRIVPENARKASAKTVRSVKASNSAGYGTGLMTGLLVVLVLVALTIGAIGFNFAGLKDQTIQLLGLEKGAQAILAVQQQALQDYQTSLEAKEQDLANLEQSLISRENILTSKEKQLAGQLDQITAAQEEQSSRQASQADLVVLYEVMDPVKLAEILSSSQTLSDHLPVLVQMNKNRLSQVLAEMSATDAEMVLNALTSG